MSILLAQMSKPTNLGRLGKSGRDQDVLGSHVDDLSTAHSQANRNIRKVSGQVGGAIKIQSNMKFKNAVYPILFYIVMTSCYLCSLGEN